ncbi:MAG: SAM-dependent methyltransferase [Chromatiales bacterium]|nr:SAM-dependent methyltransferase [Chromatiales bacterium]
MPHPNRVFADLPAPDAGALAHSARVADLIAGEIAAHDGFLPFHRYMDLALYAPGLGYYVAGARKLGAAGDFITAPELSPLFARCLARQCAEVLHACDGEALLEFGAGSGALAAELLCELERLDALPAQYQILDVSPDLRQRQRERIASTAPHLLDRVHWIDAPPTQGFRGVMLANEVLDALPVDVFAVRETGLMDRGVGIEDGRFVWREREASERLRAAVARIEADCGPLPVGYVSEIDPNLNGWIATASAGLECGLLLLIDYGFPRREYYHPQRHMGTLLAHYRHRALHDPLDCWPGLADVTASVDFTAVAEAGESAGLTLAGYTAQSWFLLGCGLEDVYREALEREPAAALDLAQAVQRLTLPSEMGERFQAIALQRGCDASLRGFALNDARGRL